MCELPKCPCQSSALPRPVRDCSRTQPCSRLTVYYPSTVFRLDNNMAEVFAIFSSTISAIDIAVRASTKLGNLVVQWKNAPQIILAISNEVADLTVVLSRIQEAEGDLKRADARHNDEFLRSLNDQLHKAQQFLAELGTFIQDLDRSTSSKKKRRWVLKGSRAATLQRDLRNTRQKINELLLTYNVYVKSTFNITLHFTQRIQDINSLTRHIVRAAPESSLN